jgi:hypothetical protein
MKSSKTVIVMKRVILFMLLGLALASCKKDDSYDGKTNPGGTELTQE